MTADAAEQFSRRLTPAEWKIVGEAIALLDAEIDQNEDGPADADGLKARQRTLHAASRKLYYIETDQGR